MDAFPDPSTLSDAELKALIEQKTNEERDVSYRRRILHGQIDLLRAVLVDRLKQRREEGADDSTLSHVDVERLSEILAHRGPPKDLPDELKAL
jgi:hypothetical protein